MDELFYYNNIKYKIIRLLRGDQGQSKLSQKLGFQFNQVHKWEVGSKSISLLEFAKYCQLFDISLSHIFTAAFSISMDTLKEEDVFSKLHSILGPKNKNDLALLLDVNKSTLYRWFKGNGAPDIGIIFYWLDMRTQYFGDIIAEIVGKEAASELIEEKNEIFDRRIKYSKYPFLAAVEYFLHLKKYLALESHDNKFIANELELTEDEVKLSINELLRCECIYLKDGKYTTAHNRTDLGTTSLEASAKMGRYWTEKCLDRFSNYNEVPTDTGEQSNMWAYRVLPVPKHLDSKIKEKMIVCMHEIIRMVEEESMEEPDEIKALVFHMFNVQDTP